MPPQLNELHNGLLMCCAADGAVRVWRNYCVRGQQRLATAWQAVLVPGAGGGARPAVYHWSPGYSALFAAGGRSAGGWGAGAVPGPEAALRAACARPAPPPVTRTHTHTKPQARTLTHSHTHTFTTPAERVYMWDLERENCIAQLNLPAPAAGAAAPCVEHIAASTSSPLLYAADSAGTGEERWGRGGPRHG